MPSVLMFCPQFRPIVGGAERQAEKLSRALVKRGVQVTVLTPQLTPDAPEHEQDSGVTIHRFPLFDLCKRFPGIRGLGPLNLLLIGWQTKKAISKYLQRIDIVHAHIASPLTAFAMQAAGRNKIPVVCKVAMTGEKSDLGELSYIGFGGSRLAYSMIRGLDRWVATTQAVKQSLLDWTVPAERIVSIPNGVDLVLDTALYNMREQTRHFLYLGRLSSTAQRDVATVIHAFDRVADVVPGVKLALVGDGDLYRETQVIVDQARNRKQIQMPGYQRPEPWLQWADCFVLPSRREGLSNALLEAMAHGLPCIANDIPPNREVLESGSAGVLVPVENENRLYDEMLQMVTVSGRADKYGKLALQRVRDCYSIDAVAEKYLELYDQLINYA